MVSRDYYGYNYDRWEPYFCPSYERSSVEIRIDYWVYLWEIIKIFISNRIGIRSIGNTRCEKERDHG